MSYQLAPSICRSDKTTVGTVNIDDLFSKADKKAKHQLQLYTKILNRIHDHIRNFGRFAPNARQTAFDIPPILFGEVHYVLSDCVDFVMRQLEDNGFTVRFTGPNRVHISWAEWIPGYVRTEYYKQTGNRIDERGQVTVEPPPEQPHVRAQPQPMSTVYHRPNIPATSSVYPAELFSKITRRVA